MITLGGASPARLVSPALERQQRGESQGRDSKSHSGRGASRHRSRHHRTSSKDRPRGARDYYRSSWNEADFYPPEDDDSLSCSSGGSNNGRRLLHGKSSESYTFTSIQIYFNSCGSLSFANCSVASLVGDFFNLIFQFAMKLLSTLTANLELSPATKLRFHSCTRYYFLSLTNNQLFSHGIMEIHNYNVMMETFVSVSS
jgi:hypothetical protein